MLIIYVKLVILQEKLILLYTETVGWLKFGKFDLKSFFIKLLSVLK